VLDLGAASSYEKGVALKAKAKKSVDYLIVGSSKAKWLMEALSSMGYLVGCAFQPNWRAFRGSANQLMSQVTSAIADLDASTVVFQLLDNSTYYARAWDGSRLPPRRADDSTFHMNWVVMVEKRDGQLDTTTQSSHSWTWPTSARG
jgi:hypothetical protein